MSWYFLARENDPEGLLAEIMGRENGVCGGGGSQHLQKIILLNGIQGGIFGNSLGMAFAEKYIIVVFIGMVLWEKGSAAKL